MSQKHVVVIGSGIVGITTAYYLQEFGFKVTILEQEHTFASGASFANGGQISFSHILPISIKSTWKDLLKYKIHINTTPTLITNYKKDQNLQTWLKANNIPDETSIQTLESLSTTAHDEYLKIHALLKDKITIKDCGILHIFRNQADLDQYITNIEQFTSPILSNRQILSREEAVELEPSLAVSAQKVHGGVYFPSDKTANCYEICHELLKYITERGCEIHYNTHITDFEIKDSKVVNAITHSGSKFNADAFVVCNGHNQTLTNLLNFNTNTYPVRGYSVMINTDYSDNSPMIGVIDAHNRMVYSKYKSHLRVAGFFDLGTFDQGLITRRTDTMVNKIYDLFPNLQRGKIIYRWTGLRPMTPNMLPITQKTNQDNAFVNTGHGPLGLTLAPSSAKKIAQIIKDAV